MTIVTMWTTGKAGDPITENTYLWADENAARDNAEAGGHDLIRVVLEVRDSEVVWSPPPAPGRQDDDYLKQNLLAQQALQDFVTTISATGGVRADATGLYCPVADPEWADLGEAYVKACGALGVKPKEAPGDDCKGK